MTDATTKLREPFKPEAVGKLPRTTCKDCSNAPSRCCNTHSKKECKDCGNYMTTAHIHLDYVGHAEVTDRLLTVDPGWTWEPLAYAPDGTPLVKKGVSGEWELWIKLTVDGVTRIGVGSVSTGFDAEKQLIGDALRNAAMRFGVALDLWSKNELESAMDDTPIIGPSAADPAREARAKFGDRVRGSVCRDAFKKWAAGEGYPDVPAKFSDDQLAKATEWLDFAESEAEHDRLVAEAEKMGVQPPKAATPEPDEAAVDARHHAAVEYVKSLDAAQLLVESARRELRAPRPVGEQRVALAMALVQDESWMPPTAEDD